MLKPYKKSHHHQIANSPLHLQKMGKPWFFLPLLLNIIATEAALGVGGGVGIGVGVGGGGGGGVWIGGGINGPNPPGYSPSTLSKAYTALQAWKSSIPEDPLGILSNWVGSDVCSYRGIFCSDFQDEMGVNLGQTVSAIDLNRGNLRGILVQELSLLTDLSLLHLNSNRFTGTVPDSFRELSSLTELDLSNNHLYGYFPTSTLQIPNLMYLDLRFNNFAGPIPDDLFNKKLDAIFLNNNQFSGEIPTNLGNSPASVINLANNKFTGTIPFSFGYMGPMLKEILFLNNKLTGCIPEGIGLWTDLQVLDVSYNSLMGHLPDSVSCLDAIEVLNFGHNQLSGVLPNLVCSLKNLLNLTVAYNFFSGFSPECNRMSFRNVGFDFSVNCIPGRTMQRPQPECSVVPGSGLSCLRIPSVRPLICGALVDSEETSSRRPPSSPP